MRGLKEFPLSDQPNSSIIFFTFRIMVGLGLAMAGLGLWAAWQRWRRNLYTNRALHRAAIIMAPSGFIAVLAGWITTEVGRQPYTIYGLLTTAKSISPIAAPAVAGSLIAFVIIYFLVFGAGVFYLLRLMSDTPSIDEHDMSPGIPMRAAGITPVASLPAHIIIHPAE